MTGREGETFPGFFYGRRGQPDTDVRGSPLGVGGSRGLGNAAIESFRHLRGWKRELSGGSGGGFVALYRRRAERQGGMHCEGLIPALPVAVGEGAACRLKKCKHFSVSFRYVD